MSDDILDRLANLEQAQLETGDEYGAEVSHRAAAALREAREQRDNALEMRQDLEDANIETGIRRSNVILGLREDRDRQRQRADEAVHELAATKLKLGIAEAGWKARRAIAGEGE